MQHGWHRGSHTDQQYGATDGGGTSRSRMASTRGLRPAGGRLWMRICPVCRMAQGASTCAVNPRTKYKKLAT